MFGSGERSTDVAEIERAVRAEIPSVRFTSPRTLRRIIKRDRELTFYGFQHAHRHVYTLRGALKNAPQALADFGIDCDGCAPQDMIIVPRGDLRDVVQSSLGSVLRETWRQIFHARVHIALERKVAEGRLSERDLQTRIHHLGRDEFEEIRGVLLAEGFLLPFDDHFCTYIEFAAFYLELRRFSPHLLKHCFPGLNDHRKVEHILSLDVDDESLLTETRPQGAFPAEVKEVVSESWVPHFFDLELIPSESEVSETKQARRLIRRARSAASGGNDVRAAILRTRAARRALPALRASYNLGARKDIERLVQRIQKSGLFEKSESEAWLRTLLPLLERASRAFWTSEARFLYDLQKVCIDLERPVFRIDLLGWLSSLGRCSIRHDQPLLRVVMAENHLRNASHRLASLRLSPEEGSKLRELVHHSLVRADAMLREQLAGPISITLAAQGIVAKNLPERVAFDKLTSELLDRISDRGHLSLGDLRDACSRSNLKLPDLASFREFLHGDRLLQADRALSVALDGVYRRGEVYLRWLQRFSSLAFATRWGRFFTLFVALPYGGAYVALEGLQHLIGPVAHYLWGVDIHIQNTASFFSLGTTALCVVNFMSFRSHFLETLRGMGRLLRTIVAKFFRLLLRLPLIREFFEGPLPAYVWHYLLKPAFAGVPLGLLAKTWGFSGSTSLGILATGFLIANLLLNSKIGRHIEEIIADEATRRWRYTTRDLIPGIFRLVMASFHAVLEAIDRLLYAVDEWLRFRTGQSRLSLVVRGVLGSIWFMIAYLIRIYVNLLIEPQVNPIKHFPVVTVSHKIILTQSLTLARIFAAPLMPLGPVAANFIAGTTVFLLPGVFGFLVWEFKENWRLYEANRRENLFQVVVGHHGETLRRFLRPGFHSGTIPKLFAKLRKIERRPSSDSQAGGIVALTQRLHHVEEGLDRFIHRDFLAYLYQSPTLGPLKIRTDEIVVATNRIRVGFGSQRDDSQFALMFEERSGRLIASVVDPGWILDLSDPQRRALLTALVGLYKMAGVEWVRPPGRGDDDLPKRGPNGGLADGQLFPMEPVQISWNRWVDAWQRDQAGGGHPPRFTVGIPLLPSPATHRGKQRRTARRSKNS